MIKASKFILLSVFWVTITTSSFAQKNSSAKNVTVAAKTENINAVSSSGKKYNVLFIAVDDLKPYIGAFGDKIAKTPNLDLLAKQSMIFTNAHTQQAVCGPSRASLLTGLRPDKTQVWDLQTLIRDKNPEIVTLPQLFKTNGYQTIGMGKIFDPRSVDKESDTLSWSVPYKKRFPLAAGYEDLAFESYQSADIRLKEKSGAKMGAGDEVKSEVKISSEMLDVPDDAYLDGAMANYAVKQLVKKKGSSAPFFMAVGFKKPHLPFVAPKKYWDLYDRNKFLLAEWQKKSVNGPDIAYHNAGELRSFIDITPLGNAPQNDLLILPPEKQKELIHAYYACISYVDAQVGKLMLALKENGLDKNTIVVFWGDHGWHFGDHSLWAKHSNFEQATHVPMMFMVPGITSGKANANPVEFVDIFPTLAELNGFPVASYLDGVSLVPALNDNNLKIKDFAISQYPRGAGKGAREFMGYSLRNNQYRFTEWVGNFFNTAKPFNANDVKAIELYDLKNDPNETKNIAADPKLKNIVEGLTKQLHNYYEKQYKTAGRIK